MNPNLLVYRALYKALPKEPRESFKALWKSMNYKQYSASEADAITDSMVAMKAHDEYMKYFNIGQKKNEMDKIERVSRYVGLALLKVWKPE